MTHRYTHEAVHTRCVEARGRPRGAKRTQKGRGPKEGKQSEVSVSKPGGLKLAYGVKRRKPQWLSAHVVTVVLVTALKFLLLLFPHLRKHEIKN